MSDQYPALPFHSMPIGISYARPRQHYTHDLRLDSPAVEGMTDLRRVTALTVERTNTLAATRERMRKLGVKMLLVTDATAAVAGIVTLTDLNSDRPFKIAAKSGESPDELLVQDIMTLRGRIEVIHLHDVIEANVGQLLSSLRESGRRHALVLQQGENGQPDEICGIFSLTRLCALLGLSVNPGDPMPVIERELAQLLGKPVGPSGHALGGR
jgi:CBS domain containing-hemolysin-like protein